MTRCLEAQITAKFATVSRFWRLRRDTGSVTCNFVQSVFPAFGTFVFFLLVLATVLTEGKTTRSNFYQGSVLNASQSVTYANTMLIILKSIIPVQGRLRDRLSNRLIPDNTNHIHCKVAIPKLCEIQFLKKFFAIGFPYKHCNF